MRRGGDDVLGSRSPPLPDRGSARDIPGWHELEWADVARSVGHWEEPEGVDLRLDAAPRLADNIERLTRLLER